MANIKITDLTAYGDPKKDDVLPIVDVGADVTKKVSVADLLENAGSGTEALPGIAFDGDPDTGIYRPGADQLAISTNGTQALYINADGDILVADGNRMEIDEIRARDGAGLKLFDDGGAGIFVEDGGNVGVSTSSPNYQLHLGGNDLGSVTGQLAFGNIAGTPSARLDGYRFDSTFKGELHFYTTTDGGTETRAITIDSLQRVGLGTTSPKNNFVVSNSGAESIEFKPANTASVDLIQTFNRSSVTYDSLLFNSADYRFAIGGTSNEKVRIDNSGRLLVGTSLQSGGSLLQVNDNRIRIASSKTPASASDTGTAGEICWDSSYIYVCTATDTWKRAALSTW